MGKYYKGIRIEGAEEFLLAVNITGNGAPTADTEAEPGMCYLDEDSEHGDLYKCIGVLVTETGTVYRWKKLAGQEEVDRLSKAKVDKAGWLPDMYIGTDAEGNLVAKVAHGSGADGNAIYRSTENYPETGSDTVYLDVSSIDTHGRKLQSNDFVILGTYIYRIDGFDGVTAICYLMFDMKGAPGTPGRNGNDYVLTAADKTEIAEIAAGLIDTALLSIIGEVAE